jgi:hypothetical protein
MSLWRLPLRPERVPLTGGLYPGNQGHGQAVDENLLQRLYSVSRGDPYLDRQLLTSVSGWYSGFSMGSIIRKRSPSAETSYSKFGVRR